MFCTNCGAKIADDSKFCGECGAKIEPLTTVDPIVNPQPVASATPVYEAPAAAPVYVAQTAAPTEPTSPVTPTNASAESYSAPVAAAAVPAVVPPVNNAGNTTSAPSGNGSYFDGDGLELLGLALMVGVLGSLTLGIYLPWGLCKIFKWRMEHTVINGRRLTFTGTGGDLFVKYLIWTLLCLVTCGIYSLWMYKAMKQWELEHTFYADMNPSEGDVCPNSFFDGSVGDYFVLSLVNSLLISLTCGIYTPWAICKIQDFEWSHSVICGDRMKFEGEGGSYFGEMIIIALLSLVTCGIYETWGICRINKWIMNRVSVISRGNVPPQ